MAIEISKQFTEFTRFAAAMLRQFGASKLRDIQRAFTGDNAADLIAMLNQGLVDWFSRVGGIDRKEINEAVTGSRDEEPTEDFKDEIRNNMDRTATSGFSTMHSILDTLLGNKKTTSRCSRPTTR